MSCYRRFTEYEKALAYLICLIPVVQFKFNLRTYQLYELLKDAKAFMHYDKEFVQRLLSNEKSIIDHENFARENKKPKPRKKGRK